MNAGDTVIGYVENRDILFKGFVFFRPRDPITYMMTSKGATFWYGHELIESKVVLIEKYINENKIAYPQWYE